MPDDDHDSKRKQHGPFWEKACEDNYPRMFSCARRLTDGRIYDAEDLTQAAVCRALFYATDPTKVKNPLSYLLGILRNVWKDQWAHEQTALTDSLDELQEKGQHPIVEPDVQRNLEKQENMDAVRVRKGPLTSREELLLRLYLADYKCKEIAGLLQEDARAIRSDLNAVRAKVRARLKKAMAKTKTSGQS